jgi:hypothetical protein
MDRNQELEEELQRLAHTVAELRGRLARLEGGGSSTEAKPSRSDRRGFLRLGAGAALGALGWAAVKAVPASAATGNNMVLGTSMVAENATRVAGDTGNPIPIFSASAQGTNWIQGTTGSFAGPLQGLGTASDVTTPVDGVDGWASGLMSAGVYGLTDSGYGVIGESSTGADLYARGSGRIMQNRRGPGLPNFIPGPEFEQVRDANGVLWIHNGTGVWRRVNTVRVDAADGSGVPFAPFRVFDTRTGAIKAANSTTIIPIAGQGAGASNIPADAVAVMGNLTATQYTGGGFLALSPAGVTVGTSSVNFITGQAAIANGFIVGLGTGRNAGKVQVKVAGHASHFLVDITAYIQ